MIPCRLMEKLAIAPSGCLEWTGAINEDGYGVSWRNGRTLRAHIFVYEEMASPVPPGLELDHLCRNRSCCHPDHLEPVTHEENLRRARAHRAPKTHCKRDHDLSVHGRPHGLKRPHVRTCRACEKEALANRTPEQVAARRAYQREWERKKGKDQRYGFDD